MNGITVDNRLDNLALIPEDFPVDMVEEPSTKSREQSLYWLAVQQLHIAPLQCVCLSIFFQHWFTAAWEKSI